MAAIGRLTSFQPRPVMRALGFQLADESIREGEGLGFDRHDQSRREACTHRPPCRGCLEFHDRHFKHAGWEDSHAEWTPTSEGPIALGSTFQSSNRFLGVELKFDLRIAEFEPNRKFAVEATTGRAKGTRISYFFEPVEGGKARLSRVTEVELDGLARLLQPLLAPITRWTGGMEANNVKRILESHH